MDILDIDKIREHFANSPIYEYYSNKGQKRAAAAALSKLRMEYGLASKMAKASIKVGAHIKGNKAMRAAGGHIKGGYISISQLLKWQKDNNHNIGELAKVKDEAWKEKIGKGNKGKVRTEYAKTKISKTLKIKNSKLTKEERIKKFASMGMIGKTHSLETKRKMSEKAKGRVISSEQRKKTSDKLSISIIAINLKTGKKKEYKSTKEAKEKLGLTGILHVLKGRSKQCGGYYFEYKK